MFHEILTHTGKCLRRFGGIYALPVLHRPEVVDIGVNSYYYVEKYAICLKDYRIRSFLSIQYVHGDLCKHLGIDSSTDHPDRY